MSPDTACPNYFELLHNMEVGHEFIENELNVTRPKVAWQVDAFGHSSTFARLLEEMGYEMLVIARVNET